MVPRRVYDVRDPLSDDIAPNLQHFSGDLANSRGCRFSIFFSWALTSAGVIRSTRQCEEFGWWLAACSKAGRVDR